MFFTAVTVVFLTIIILGLASKISQKYHCRGLETMPQPEPHYPIVGNLFDYFQTPEKLFLDERHRAKSYGPIHKTVLMDNVAVNLFNPEDIEILLSDMKHITKSLIYDFLHGWLGTGLLTSTEKKWQTRRKILTPAFHFNILQEFIKIFNEETKNLVEDLKKQCNQPIDVVPPITQFTLISIGETAMGSSLALKQKENEDYKSAIYQIGQLLTYRIARPWLYYQSIYNITSNGQEEKRLVNILHNFSEKVIGERKKQFKANPNSYSTRKRLAMLDLLLKYQSEGADINDEGIREEVDTFMFEGHDTTSLSICYTLMLLANNPQIQDEIVREMHEVLADFNEFPTYNELQDLKYMERCIKESLRLYPSVPFISRFAGEDFKTHTGYVIRKDVMVNVYIYDLHRNPIYYPDPLKFDPDRFLPENCQDRHPFAYIPFSAGPRNCIGQKFAILELKSVMCGILKEFKLEPVDRPEDLVFITDLVLRTKNGVKVKFTPRKTD